MSRNEYRLALEAQMIALREEVDRRKRRETALTAKVKGLEKDLEDTKAELVLARIQRDMLSAENQLLQEELSAFQGGPVEEV